MAKELVTTGEPISADRAHRHKIVNRVVRDDTGYDLAQDLAADVIENLRLATVAVKLVVDEELKASLNTDLSFENEVTFILFATADVIERIDAYIGKQDSEFEDDDRAAR